MLSSSSLSVSVSVLFSRLSYLNRTRRAGENFEIIHDQGHFWDISTRWHVVYMSISFQERKAIRRTCPAIRRLRIPYLHQARYRPHSSLRSRNSPCKMLPDSRARRHTIRVSPRNSRSSSIREKKKEEKQNWNCKLYTKIKEKTYSQTNKQREREREVEETYRA